MSVSATLAKGYKTVSMGIIYHNKRQPARSNDISSLGIGLLNYRNLCTCFHPNERWEGTPLNWKSCRT